MNQKEKTEQREQKEQQDIGSEVAKGTERANGEQ